MLAIIAIPLAPLLYKDHFVLLVLLRPTKEVLLAAGFFARKGEVSVAPVVLAAIPLLIFGVWLFYFLGRAYADEIAEAKLPGLPGRLLPPKRIEKLRDALGEDGRLVVFLGRLSVFPSSLLAAAAGVSEMHRRRFFAADALGGLLSIAEAFGVGWILGEAYEDAGPWLTAVGFALFAAAATLLGRKLTGRTRASGPRKERAQDDDGASTSQAPTLAAAASRPL